MELSVDPLLLFQVGMLRLKSRMVLDVDYDSILGLDAKSTEAMLARVGMIVINMRCREGCQCAPSCIKVTLSGRRFLPLRKLIDKAHLNCVSVVLRHEETLNRRCERCLATFGTEEALGKQFDNLARLAIQAGFDGTELALVNGTACQRPFHSDGSLGLKPTTIEACRMGHLLDTARRASAVWGSGGRVGVKICVPLAAAGARKTDGPGDCTRGLFSALENLGLMYVRISDSLGDEERSDHRQRQRRLVRDLRARFGGAYMASADRGLKGVRLKSIGSPDLLALPWTQFEQF